MTKAALRHTASPAALIAAMLLAAPAWAQAQSPADAAEGHAESVVVVGSRARSHSKITTTVPVDVFAGKELKRALARGEVGQALQDLSPSINMPRESASGTSDTVRVIQIRGLPPDETLVLLDGKRRHTSAVPDTEGIFQGTVPVDINTIPAGMIDRIELLRDGAGALYGSDAIAGVVNIHLNRKPSGGSASVGFGGNVTNFAPTGQTLADGQTVNLSFNQGLALGEGGYLRFGAEGVHAAGNNRAGPSDAYWTSYYATPADTALNGHVLFKSGEPAYDKGDLFYNAALPLQNGWEAYSFATYDFRHTEGAAFFRFPGDPSNDPAIYPAGYRPVTLTDGFDIGFVAGLRYETADPWTWDISLRQGDNEVRYGVTNSLNASLGDLSPTSFHLVDYISRQTALNADGTRELEVGLPAPLHLAFGAEYMHEIYETGAGSPASYAAGPITSDSYGSAVQPGAQAGPGLRPQDAVSLSRDDGAFYAEAETDLARRWTVNIAGRFSGYTDVGTSGTGKISTRYGITDDLSLRGSFSNSFRAPALAQQGFRFASLNFNSDGTGLQNNVLVPATDPLAQALGASKLKPETAQNFTIGAAWKLPYNTVLTVDGYYITVDHRIVRSSDLQSDAISAYLQSIGRTDVQSVAFLTNALDTTTRGVDIALDQQQKLWGGVLALRGALNLNRVHIDTIRAPSARLAQIDPSITSLFTDGDLLRARSGSPESKLILSSSWSTDRLDLLLRATRYGTMYNRSFDDAAPTLNGVPAQAFGPKWVVDLEGTYHITRAWAFTLGANNLFDVYPTRTLPTNNATYGGALPYDPISPIGISGAYYYSRLSYSW